MLLVLRLGEWLVLAHVQTSSRLRRKPVIRSKTTGDSEHNRHSFLLWAFRPTAGEQPPFLFALFAARTTTIPFCSVRCANNRGSYPLPFSLPPSSSHLPPQPREAWGRARAVAGQAPIVARRGHDRSLHGGETGSGLAREQGLGSTRGGKQATRLFRRNRASEKLVVPFCGRAKGTEPREMEQSQRI
jgi:hypothetical protein